MPCGSTILSSTDTLDAATPARPDSRRSWKTLLGWLAGIALWWVWRPQYRQLRELDDHLLSDIGVSRTPAEEARRSQLYLNAWRNSL
jgi:uncharacterized protein YjiS (DUF1127 family)